MNKRYFGDNLEILRELDNERLHLIGTDPPFNTRVRLPDAWCIRPTQKSERHFDNRQMQRLSG